MLDATFSTVKKDAGMVRLTNIRQCLTPCATPMAENQELVTMFENGDRSRTCLHLKMLKQCIHLARKIKA